MAEKIGFPELNLPVYEFRLKNEKGKNWIFDDIRKKFVQVTPEEWVRQNFITYLIREKNYPQNLMAVEKKVLVNNLTQRFDLVVYDRKGNPFLVAEFKSPTVKISDTAFSQAVRYNSNLKVPLILVSNGIKHYICRIDYLTNSASYLKEIPEFES
jgi:type I site-specific restriction endonuclease